jgi:hypothetical protein
MMKNELINFLFSMLHKHAIQKRLIIYPKDIKMITGKSYRRACILWNEVRKTLNKAEHQVLTIREFCDYMGLEEQLVLEFLN